MKWLKPLLLLCAGLLLTPMFLEKQTFLRASTLPNRMALRVEKAKASRAQESGQGGDPDRAAHVARVWRDGIAKVWASFLSSLTEAGSPDWLATPRILATFRNSVRLITKGDMTMVKWRSSQMVSLSGLLLLLMLGTACSKNAEPTPSSTPTPAPQAALAGTWTGCMFLEFQEIVFHADGTANLDNYVIHYTFNGTQIEFDSLPQDYNYAMTEYSALLSSDSNLLTLTDVQGNFCVLARPGSSGEQKLLSSIVGAWTGGNCTDSQNILQFHSITFLTNGTFTSDATYTSSGSSNGTYTIPQAYSDDSTLGLTFGDEGPELFRWEISADGTLTLFEPGGSPCYLTHS